VRQSILTNKHLSGASLAEDRMKVVGRWQRVVEAKVKPITADRSQLQGNIRQGHIRNDSMRE
jgi:hypothetical protein